jgi:small subunit ribosomal protein S1
MPDENIENNPPDVEKSAINGEQEENFAAMFEKSSMGERLSPGQKVKAKVVSISGELVYIDLGGKSEGAVALAEFMDEHGVSRVHEGDKIEVFFVTVQDGVMKLTTLIGGYSALTLQSISDAYEAGVPVNGEVKREIKGGFEISVGGVKGFCPFSHIDIKGGHEDNGYPGLTFPFKVLEYGEEGRKIVLSRRALLEQEIQAKIEKLKEGLAVGKDVAAKIKSIQSFGAFVDLGGIDGLIPVSEISWDRSVNPKDILFIGQDITAKVISLDWEKNRIALSLKAGQPDPWISAAEKYPVDSRISGTIVRLSPFGAFVRLEPGIDGLVHISNLGAGRRINHPKEIVQTGQLVEVYVLSVDQQNRKIALSMQPKVEPVKIVLPGVGEILSGIVEKVMPFGVFLTINGNIKGLVPNMETGTPPGTDLKRAFPPGTEIQVTVIEVDTAHSKVRLSRKAVLEKTVQDEFNEYKESINNSTGPSGSLGSFGDMLKAKLEEKKQQG